MTFCGENIGNTATLMQVEIYVAEKGLFIEPQEAYDYWAKKNWMTSDGKPVKSLEACVNYINGKAVLEDMKARGLVKMKPKAKSPKAVKGKVKQIEQENKRSGPRIPYKEQLGDGCWKAFRTFVFKVRGKKCEVCGATSQLQVHHLEYRNVKAWEYTVNEVLVVCRSCHKKIHGIK